MRIDIEYIKAIIAARRLFNSIPLEDIEFYENGEKLEIPKGVIHEFQFTGLYNSDFVDNEFWKEVSHE